MGSPPPYFEQLACAKTHTHRTQPNTMLMMVKKFKNGKKTLDISEEKMVFSKPVIHHVVEKNILNFAM